MSNTIDSLRRNIKVLRDQQEMNAAVLASQIMKLKNKNVSPPTNGSVANQNPQITQRPFHFQPNGTVKSTYTLPQQRPTNQVEVAPMSKNTSTKRQNNSKNALPQQRPTNQIEVASKTNNALQKRQNNSKKKLPQATAKTEAEKIAKAEKKEKIR